MSAEYSVYIHSTPHAATAMAAVIPKKSNQIPNRNMKPIILKSLILIKAGAHVVKSLFTKIAKTTIAAHEPAVMHILRSTEEKVKYAVMHINITPAERV